MTEQAPQSRPDHEGPREDRPAEQAPVTTGVPAVDAVLEEVDRVGDLPLEDQLAAFERAHEALRSALDTPSADGPAADRPALDDPGDPA